MSCGKCGSGVIQSLAAARNLNGKAAKSTDDWPGQTNGCGIAFDGENFAFERRDRDSAEGLQRVHGADGRAPIPDSFKRAGIQRAAGVQHYFTAQFFRAYSRQLCGDFYDRIVGSGYQDQARGQNFTRERRACFSGADEAHRLARGGFTSCYDRADFPIQFMQTPSKGTTDAPCAYDRQSTTHVMLG